MKKRAIAAIVLFCLLLGSCAEIATPQTAADGTPWGEDWTDVGVVLGVEPVEGWNAQRSEDLLADVGMYFASWTWGKAETDSDGETVYPAQVFLVMSGAETEADAEKRLGEWQTIAGDTYVTEPARTLEHKLGAFTLLPYRFADDSGNFDMGMIALGVVNGYAVNLEFSCRDGLELDPEQVLTAFLDGFHFAG